jgi:hypothetical protein
MRTIFASVRFALVLALALVCRQALAFDLDGAWATNVSVCDKIFGKTAQGSLFIKKDADTYGSGFIVRQSSIVGKIANCTIKKKKTEGTVTHVIASCSTDVALQTVQFSFEVKDENHIIRIYPGVEELNIAYGRCPP